MLISQNLFNITTVDGTFCHFLPGILTAPTSHMALPADINTVNREEASTDLLFSCSGLNKRFNQEATIEAIGFGLALHCSLNCIPEEEPVLGPAFLSKVELSDSYMLVWVHLTGITSMGFLI